MLHRCLFFFKKPFKKTSPFLPPQPVQALVSIHQVVLILLMERGKDVSMAWPVMGKRCQTAGLGIASGSSQLWGCSCLSMTATCCRGPDLGKRLVSADPGHLLIFSCCWGSPSDPVQVWRDPSLKSLGKVTRWHRKMMQRICLPCGMGYLPDLAEKGTGWHLSLHGVGPAPNTMAGPRGAP